MTDAKHRIAAERRDRRGQLRRDVIHGRREQPDQFECVELVKRPPAGVTVRTPQRFEHQGAGILGRRQIFSPVLALTNTDDNGQTRIDHAPSPCSRLQTIRASSASIWPPRIHRGLTSTVPSALPIASAALPIRTMTSQSLSMSAGGWPRTPPSS